MDKPTIKVIDSGDLARITISGAINLKTATCEEILSIHPRVAMAYSIYGLKRILSCGYPINAKTSKDGHTLLMLGCYSDRFYKKVEYLLDKGANMNIKSKNETALDIAIKNKCKKIILLLIEYDVKYTKKNALDINTLFGKKILKNY